MEKIKIQDLSFTYALGKEKALSHISMEIEEGDFVLLLGKSGSGKSTLLKQLKNEAMPKGTREGTIQVEGKAIEEVDTSLSIGLVMQNVENQLICDKVWHELAFGLENQNMPLEEMRIRVAETCYFFNLQDIFEEDIAHLSGGQKELVVLASVMMMHPDVLILDEPLSKLDTTVKEELLKYLKKIHEELGTTIIIAEHNLKDLVSLANRVVVMEEGKIEMQGNTRDVMQVLLLDKKYQSFLPCVMRLPMYFHENKVLIHVGEARNFLKEHITQKEGFKKWQVENSYLGMDSKVGTETVLQAKEIWFRYAREDKDILRGVNLTLKRGEVYTLLAGNGSGKTTLLCTLCSLLKPYAGRIQSNGKIVMLPQNPKTLFCQNIVKDELKEVQKEEHAIQKMIDILALAPILEAHPFDISGGEEERLGLAKVFLTNADIFLLDEPTKGLDATMKEVLKGIIWQKRKEGKTFLIVTHDMEFAASIANRCGMLFCGEILAENNAASFFEKNLFYTTDFVRITKNIVPSFSEVKQDKMAPKKNNKG